MRHASLFSGIGGPEIAAAMIGWDNVFHCEINPFGRQILDYWFPNSDSYEDITKTDFKQYRGSVDVLTGGFPCQPFSYAGKRKGQTDDRYLWPEMLRVIDEIRPTWVIGENVAGITTMVEPGKTTYVGSETPILEENRGVHRFRTEHTFTIERICKDLEQIGYSVQSMLIPACAVGAPHRRDRVFIIARIIADPDCGNDLREPREYESKSSAERISKRDKIRKPGESDHVRSEMQSPSADSSCKGLEGQNESRSGEGRERMYIWRNLAGCCAADDLRPERRWQTFPSVSPVHRGNDGLPFDVDSLSISPAKWRTESLKAYGNAIVPQVMYRIFQCIEQLNV
jgi:DNA (cytosine-5)-methyltransferase 1